MADKEDEGNGLVEDGKKKPTADPPKPVVAAAVVNTCGCHHCDFNAVNAAVADHDKWR